MVWKRFGAMPGEKVASKFDGAFAVESALVIKPMGYNARDGALQDHDSKSNAEIRERILEYCPELRMVMPEKKCRDNAAGSGERLSDTFGATEKIAETRRLRQAEAKMEADTQAMAKAQAEAMMQAQARDQAKLLAKAREMAQEQAMAQNYALAQEKANEIDKANRLFAQARAQSAGGDGVLHPLSPPPPLPPLRLRVQ